MIKKILSLTLLFCCGAHLSAMDKTLSKYFSQLDKYLYESMVLDNSIDQLLKNVNQLLEEGAKPSGIVSTAKGTDFTTSLHLAVQVECIPLVTLFLKKCANVNCVDSHGRTPLSLFIKNYSKTKTVENTIEIIRILSEKGADFSIIDNDGYNLLHCACCGVGIINPKIIKTIIEEGVDVNKKDGFGSTPSHYLAEAARSKAFKNTKDIKNITTVLALFKQKNVDLNILNYERRKPYDIAIISEGGKYYDGKPCSKELAELFLPN